MEPGEEAGRPRRAGETVALGMPVRLLLAAPRAPGEQQRRDRRRELRHQPIGLEREARLRRLLLVEWIGGAGERISARRHLGERPFDCRASRLELLRVLGGGHMHRIADDDGKRRERQIDGEGAPGRQLQEVAGGDGERHHRPARLRGERGDADARAPRRAWRHVSRHGHGGAEASARRDSRMAVAPPRFRFRFAGAGASDQVHAEALQHRADNLRIAVARDHGFHLRRPLGLEVRQQHELAVPHGEDLRMLVEQLGVRVGRLALDGARGVDQADIGRGERAEKSDGGLRCEQPFQRAVSGAATRRPRRRRCLRLGGGRIPSGDAELGAVQSGVEAAFGDELVMAADLDDAALVEHADQVGLLHRRQPVRDHQHRAAPHQPFERRLHLGLGFRVERAGRLVEQQDRRVLVDGPRDGDALALAAGQQPARLADARVVALRQAHDEIVRRGGLAAAITSSSTSGFGP